MRNKLWEMKRKKRNNKGFSLVELIIVIAIMAILVAILAPQFLKYVERSRNTADIANAREITNAVIAYAVDTEVEDNEITGATTITVDKTHAGASGANAKVVLDAMREAGITATNDATAMNDVKCKSKTSWTSYTIAINIDDKGVVIFNYDATGGKNNEAFKNAFQQGKGTGGGSSSGNSAGGN